MIKPYSVSGMQKLRRIQQLDGLVMGVSWSEYFMYILSIFGGLITPVFFSILSLNSPDVKVETLCLELCCFVCVIQPNQLSCLGSSIGRASANNTECCGFESHLRQHIFCLTVLVHSWLGEACSYISHSGPAAETHLFSKNTACTSL